MKVYQRMNDLNAESLVTITQRPTEAEASVFVSILRDAGIQAVAVGGFTAGFRAEAPGWVQIKTLQRDADAAKQVLAELRRIETD
ncbi:MAG: DUF2007 domain-containing protein [Planctomycetota bacterium]